MAAGDVTVFNQAGLDLGNNIMNYGSDTFNFALITASTTPLATTAGPHFNGTGTTDMSTNEVTAGGNYSAGGVALAGRAWSGAAGTKTLAFDKVLIAQNAANPTNARWGIIYDNTDANKRCLAFCDFGAVFDLTIGPFEFRFNSIDGNGAMMNLVVN